MAAGYKLAVGAVAAAFPLDETFLKHDKNQWSDLDVPSLGPWLPSEQDHTAPL